jgi:beta-mannosidase
MFTKEYYKQYGGKFLIDLQEIEESRVGLPEEHYWWHRDDYETYSKMKHCFVGEIGYSGCPSIETLQNCLPMYALNKENEYSGDAWKYHDYSTDGDVRHASKYYFGELPDTIEDFVLSSQISQAEAYKYLIEYTRLQKPYMTGVLLWNMRDGWPAYNSALVDYYGRKKLSYYYVRQSQQPLVGILDEGLRLTVCNDAMTAHKGGYKIYNGKGQVLVEGEFSVEKNKNSVVGEFTSLQAEKYLIIELSVGENTYLNHFINEKRIHDFEGYKKFLTVYQEKANICL